MNLAVTAEQIHEAELMMQRFRALQYLPKNHPKRIIWDRLWGTTAGWLAPIWRHLPDPLAKPGRPKGTGRITDVMLDEMDRRTADGTVPPTAAARAIVGTGAGRKNRADHLVKVWRRKRGNNSADK